RFPFSPYSIQLEFMRALFDTIEAGRVGIFESPTGTGKSLSLICGALKWLEENEARVDRLEEAQVARELETVDDDGIARRRTLFSLSRTVPNTRLQSQTGGGTYLPMCPRERLQKMANVDSMEGSAAPADDSEFILDEPSSSATQAATKQTTEEEPDVTKIFYCSRTHSQLSQFIHELRKTAYADVVRSVSLGSRQNLCINDRVRALGSITKINDRCLELQRKGRSKQCKYFVAPDSNEMLHFRDHVMADVRDIEDLGEIGRDVSVCAYYGARTSIRPCQVITLPYNLLLQRAARESLGISLKDHIVIVDEAHNLADTITGVHSISISSLQLETTYAHLTAYLNRYRTRLSVINATHVRELVVVIKALVAFLRRWRTTGGSAGARAVKVPEMYTANTFLHELNVDDINMLELQRFLKESHLARKVQCTRRSSAHAGGTREENTSQHAYSPSWMHQIEAFLVSLLNADDDGRVMVSLGPNAEEQKQAGVLPNQAAGALDIAVHARYLLLNPAEHFRQVVEEARSVVLAGGTMAPVDDLISHLVPYLPAEKIHRFSCGHVVPRESPLALSVCEGPTGIPFEFTYEKRDDAKLLDSLGQSLVNLCNVIPAGVVCFFSSYAYMDTVHRRWLASGINARLEKRKRASMQRLCATLPLADFLNSKHAATNATTNGALLFCVVGGKMSEGINFSDDLGRGVVMVGLPFPSLNSPELQEKLRFIGAQVSSGRVNLTPKGVEYYENMCMRAVNQSIGRAIRHQGDYAVIALLDRRYSTERIRTKLPGWIADRLVDCSKFGHTLGQTAAFF
ncbi:helicase C-terminal domain-containing protein, partial [Thamnocephalis sphaerospora]